jgi:hypothetical protein
MRFVRVTRMRALLLILPLVVLTACASSGGGDTGAQPTSPSATAGGGRADHLEITIDRGDGREPEQYTLVCDGDQPSTHPDATHPDARAACGHLAGLDEPFAPIPGDMACTQIYGGPQTATITGRWDGKPVQLQLSRVDGCRIAQWDSLGPVLPGPVG